MIDVYLTVDSADHPAYRRPNRVAEALSEMFGDPVRSVTIVDASTGISANCRYDV
jgi:hypothetical protein